MDIEAQMTLFAYYYVGIGFGVLIVSYFQVSMHVTYSALIFDSFLSLLVNNFKHPLSTQFKTIYYHLLAFVLLMREDIFNTVISGSWLCKNSIPPPCAAHTFSI